MPLSLIVGFWSWPSDVNKDFSHKNQDKDFTVKDKDKGLSLKDRTRTVNFI